MYHNKRKVYTNRKLFRGVQLVVVTAVALMGLAVLDQWFRSNTPTVEEAVVIAPQVQQAPETVYVMPQVEQSTAYTAFDYFSLGLNSQTAMRYQEAVDYYTQSVELDPTLSASWLNRGVAYEQMGYPSVARKDFWEFVQRNSTEIIAESVVNGRTLTLDMAEGRMFIIPFTAKAGDILNIRAESVISGEPGEANVVDPLIVVVDAAQTPLAANDDALYSDGSLISMNSRISDYMVMQDGSYALVVHHAGGGSYGALNITFTLR